MNKLGLSAHSLGGIWRETCLDFHFVMMMMAGWYVFEEKSCLLSRYGFHSDYKRRNRLYLKPGKKVKPLNLP